MIPDATALVMARAPLPGRCKTLLEPLLGPEGCARLQAVLVRRAAAWAAAVAPGRAVVAFDPPDARDEVAALLAGAGVELLAQQGDDLGERLKAASAFAFEHFGGPLLVAGTDLPRLSATHAQAALLDIAQGADVSFGPAHDGGYYLLALAAPRPELFALDSGVWGGAAVLAKTLEVAHRLGLEVGLLRMERDLETPEDAAGLLADPLLAPEVRTALTGRA